MFTSVTFTLTSQGIVHTLLGQREGSADHTKQAQQAFQVGSCCTDH